MTQAPLPDLGGLWKATHGPVPNEDTLAGPWTGDGEGARWFSRSAWSLAALGHARRQQFGTARPTVWIPDFFCEESLSPLRAIGARLIFYGIHGEGEVGPASLLADDGRPDPDLFVLAHYFGNALPTTAAVEFCRKRGAWLVEDAAHQLTPMPGVGDAGDFVLYSPHKLFAIPDGAVLVVRTLGPSALDLDSVLALVDDARKRLPVDRMARWLEPLQWAVKRSLQTTGMSRSRMPSSGPPVSGDLSTQRDSRMTALAARLLQHQQQQIPSIIELRRSNARLWQRVMSSIGQERAANSVLGVPYMVGVGTSGAVATSERRKALWTAGVPAATWPDLPPEVTASPVGHDRAIDLRDSRVYLPVHQSITSADIAASAVRLWGEPGRRWSARPIASREEWNRLWPRAARPSLSQSWEYGAAKELAENWRAHRLVVTDQADVPRALFQVLQKGAPVVGTAARVNRGPVMLGDEEPPDVLQALRALVALRHYARSQKWRLTQIAPLLPPDPLVTAVMRQLGFVRQSRAPADSALLSLLPAEDALLGNLDRKWRNSLRKGQKLDVHVELQPAGSASFEEMLHLHRAQQAHQGFIGTSEALLRAMAEQAGPAYGFYLFRATSGPLSHGATLGYLVTVRFGRISEYFVGTVNDEGRRLQANSVLLWEAIRHARRIGCQEFDVGGLAANTPPGIAAFKSGLNATPYALTGEWRRWL